MADEYGYRTYGLLKSLAELQNLPAQTGLADTDFAIGIIPDNL